MKTNLLEKFMGKSIYIQSKIDGNAYCKSNGQFTRHLRMHGLTYQEYYEQYVSGEAKRCRCGKPKTFYQQSETYAESCGDPVCIGHLIKETKANWTDEQRMSDSVNKQKWAASRTAEDKEKSREVRKRTNRERYGVDYTTQSTQMMNKTKITKQERYGHEYYSNPKQTSDSWQSKTIEEIAIITEKKRVACLDKYGVENPFFLPHVRRNSAIANSIGREFALPSGKMIRLRGYEDVAITELLKTYTEEELVVDDVLLAYNLPVFTYTAVSRHLCKYYPDIYIPAEDKIIEVKGRWWWDGNGIEKYKNRLINNLRKRNAVLVTGYTYEVWLFENRTSYRILKDDTDFITE